ncbi:MAG: hypothetical protein IJC09_04620 [Clostridia bacterium]|nr:hypothetical protein [Clostridia bacterium]
MEKFNFNRRNITIIASYLFLTAIFFIFGLLIGFHNGDDPILKEASNTVTVPDNTLLPVITAPPSNYRVILEDGELRLYIDENGISRLISREEISEDSYPVSDIASLKKGLIFETADGAISLMENFIS